MRYLLRVDEQLGQWLVNEIILFLKLIDRLLLLLCSLSIRLPMLLDKLTGHLALLNDILYDFMYFIYKFLGWHGLRMNKKRHNHLFRHEFNLLLEFIEQVVRAAQLVTINDINCKLSVIKFVVCQKRVHHLSLVVLL